MNAQPIYLSVDMGIKDCTTYALVKHDPKKGWEVIKVSHKPLISQIVDGYTYGR